MTTPCDDLEVEEPGRGVVVCGCGRAYWSDVLRCDQCRFGDECTDCGATPVEFLGRHGSALCVNCAWLAVDEMSPPDPVDPFEPRVILAATVVLLPAFYAERLVRILIDRIARMVSR